ncbi:MAG: hypothetical protein L0312_23280, partial [Acidobacteria bacterium]|nr:hypothetical protein [Acidobacteriota bacterium]
DRVVNAVSPSEATRRQLLGNRLYQNVSALIAGMHEYTAVEALHAEFVWQAALELPDRRANSGQSHHLLRPRQATRGHCCRAHFVDLRSRIAPRQSCDYGDPVV